MCPRISSVRDSRHARTQATVEGLHQATACGATGSAQWAETGITLVGTDGGYADVSIENKLIAAGVRNLRTYGYPECNESNILTDKIYSALFESMLKDNKGNGDSIDAAIDGLLKRIAQPSHFNPLTHEQTK